MNAQEVLQAAGVSFVTLREWIRRGIVPPALEAVKGRGNLAKYPRHAVLQADLARRLRAEGWTLDAIAEHMKTRPWDGQALAPGEDESKPRKDPSGLT